MKGSSFRSTERGAALAEFALVLPLLLILIFGLIEFGIAFNRAQAVEAAAREGGRLASLSATTPAQISSRVDEALIGIPMDGPVDVDPGLSCIGRQGEEVHVTVSVDHDIEIPMLFSTTITLSSEAVFRCEA